MVPGARILKDARSQVAAGLGDLASRLESEGMPVPEWSGKLIRPLIGYAASGGEPSEGVWASLAAVQLAHEASLLHDDVVDGAASRRGRPTLVARAGVGAALVEGDHLLTAAYRVASWTGSAAWMTVFARAVERTVAGEKAQARSAGAPMTLESYEAVVLGKSGELLGAALAAPAVLRGDPAGDRWLAVGRRLGLVYQMLDDLLDYCPHVDTGKAALGDYARGLWTWPLPLLGLEPGLSPDAVLARLRVPDASGTLPLQRCVDDLETIAGAVRSEAAALLPGDIIIQALLDEWLATARSAAAALELPDSAGWEGLMAEHGRTFRFASRLFPARQRERVTGVYAWCRYTDDLVDRSHVPAGIRSARLDAWLELSRRAYDGERTGHPLADAVMGEMRTARVPFGYAEELIEGMRMDLRGTTYGTMNELFRYTYRVASVVGLWVTELFDIRDPWLLERAAALGHAMQLTNILRDVGEDLRAGRVYLPTTWLTARALTRGSLVEMMEAGTVTEDYAALVEDVMAVADREYDHAIPAIRGLPAFYRRPVAVAAEVYRGIHDRIRDNGYDNLTRRAHTTARHKVGLGARALARGLLAPALALTVALAGPRLLHAQQVVPAGAEAAREAVAAEPAPHPVAAEWAPRSTAAGLDAVAGLWLAAVDEPRAVDAGLETVARVRSELPADAGAARRLLRAYEGSLISLRARHGGWPPERLRNLRRGFAIMDATVAEDPGAAELRYIRLMSGFHLPAIFGRGDVVEEDLAALPTLLPHARDRFPQGSFAGVVAFVLEHGDPDASDRARLEAMLP